MLGLVRDPKSLKEIAVDGSEIPRPTTENMYETRRKL